MFSRNRTLKSSLAYAAVTLSLLPAVQAQQSGAQTSAPVPVNSGGAQVTANPTGPVVLSGFIVDPDGAAIPGATVTLTLPSGKAYTVTSGGDGDYALKGVPAGTYAFTATMPGFASFVRQGLKISATAQTLTAKLAIQTADQTVNVTASQVQVSVDADSNASASVLKGKDLDALSDDPDELAAELSALAGPAAGPNGGQIYIDGFTGGQLPPKSSIREIRINQNPFSAQYDRPGFGRVEVFTKPGTDKFHGSVQLNGADKSFNTGSVFIKPGTVQPDYHTILGFGSLTGPINKKASFTMSGSLRKIQDNSVINPLAIYSTSQQAGTACLPGQAGCTEFNYPNSFNGVQFSPQTRWDVSPRVDLALGEKNTLTVRFQYEHNGQQNQGIGGLDLASTGYNSTGAETTIQISDTQIVSAKVINETRFEYQRPTSNSTPFSTAASINVQGSFVSGGSSSQTSTDTQNHIEVQNYTSVALAKHFLRLGGRLRSTNDNNTTTANSNGTFVYNSLCDYAGYAATVATGTTSTCTNGVTTTANTLADYQVTNIVNPTVSARSTDLGLYAEDDWKVKPNFTFSYGLRYETQNFISDHHDFAPRLSVAYGVTKKTVIRAGAGIFYDRFTLGNQLNVARNNGINQQEYTLSSTSGALPTACNPTTPAGCTPYLTTTGRLTERVIAVNQSGGFTNLRSGYQFQTNLGVDQQLLKNMTLSVNYQHIRGVHQFNSDVPNYLAATGSTTNPLLYQYQSNGVFNQNQLIANVNYRGKYGSLGSYYVLNFVNSDVGTAGSFASIPNHLAADYGRASYDIRNRMFLFGSFNLPHLITASPFIVASSGAPYNVTSGLDVFHDNIFNGRAVVVPQGTVAGAGQTVKTIGGCGTFATPGTAGITALAPVNACTGPGNVTINLRLAKTFGFGETRAQQAADAAQRNGGQQGAPPGGGRGPGGGGPGGGGGGRGGGGGGFGGGGASSGRKYNLTLGAQAQNLFNVADRSAPVGVLTSPSFGQSSQLAGGIFTTDSAIRRITLNLSFTF